MDRLIKKLVVYAMLLAPLLLSANVSAEVLENVATYTLKIEKGLISLNAKDASLSAVLEDIGQKMAVEVVNNVPAEDKVTVTFDKLPLQEAIKKLSANYVYLMDSEKEKGNITKIVVLPKGSEMDYSRLPEEKTVRVSSSPVIPEPQPKKETTVHKPLKPKAITEKESVKTEEHAKKEKPKSEPFKFTFDPVEDMKKQ